MKIAVFGSAKNEISPYIEIICKEIGAYLAEKGVTVVTGGSSGIPGIIVKSAFESGAHTEAYSPDENETAHEKRNDNLPLNYFKSHKFIPGFTARSLAMVKDCDGVLVVGGRIGTLSEFTIALEEGLSVAVVKGTGGVSNHLEYIINVAEKEFPNQAVIFEDDYKKAIDSLISFIESN
jgi:uncharacterized protein (TIGR00725 family)